MAESAKRVPTQAGEPSGRVYLSGRFPLDSRRYRFGMRLIHTTSIPGEEQELGLYQLRGDYFIKVVGGQDLMNTRAHASETALGAMSCEHLTGRDRARVLVGGLGMGFTLSAILGTVETDAEVVVAEVVPGVVEWNRGVLGPFAGQPLDDPRTQIQVVDVSLLLKTRPAAFDAIVLDVDNGPDGLTRESNQWLYTTAGLSVAFQALRPGGVLSIWSAGPDRAFVKRLRGSGFSVEEVTVRAHAGKGARHVIWRAQRP